MRTRASVLRAKVRAGAILAPEDAAWLADYEDERLRVADERAFGASRGRKESYTLEEHEAVGEGSAAAEMAAAGSMVREEGRRLDSLVSVGISALRLANETYREILSAVMERNQSLEAAHVKMMGIYSSEFMNRVSAESEVERLAKEVEGGGGEDKKDGLTQLADQLLPLILAQMGGNGPAGPKPGK